MLHRGRTTHNALEARHARGGLRPRTSLFTTGALRSLAIAALAAMAAACGTTPPPEPVEPAMTAEPPAPPPKKKPKPCKALDEECEAKTTTHAKIAGSSLTIKPAKGWMYAQGEKATIAQLSADGPAVAVAEIEIDDAKQEAAKREASLSEIAADVSVTLPKKKVNWKKPDDTKEIAGMKVGLWQVDGATRGEKKGPLLIFAAPLEDGKKSLIGFGFVPSDDSSGADAAILESIESIAPPEE